MIFLLIQKSKWLALIFTLLPTLVSHASDWEKINNAELLKPIFNNTTLRGISWARSEFEINKLPTDWEVEYCQDGTGVLTFMGLPNARKWRLSTNAKWRLKSSAIACITTDLGEKCYFYEQHVKYGKLYRAGLVGDNIAPWTFVISDEIPSLCNNQ